MNELIQVLVPIVIAVMGSQGFWALLQSKNDKSKQILTSVENVEKNVLKIDQRVTAIENENAEAEARNCRNRIVRFADEIRSGKKASKDYYDHIMTDIDRYEKYCDAHPDFVNSIAKVSVQKIISHYNSDDFL